MSDSSSEQPPERTPLHGLARTLVRSPDAIVRWVGDALQITTPQSDRTVDTESVLVLRILSAFTQPTRVADVAARFPKQAPQDLCDVIAQLVAAGILLDAESGSAEAQHRPTQPLTTPARHPVGKPVSLDQLKRDRIEGGLVLLGAPCELGAGGEGGTRQGPGLIRSRFPIPGAFGGSAVGGDAASFLRRSDAGMKPTLALDIDGRRSYTLPVRPLLDVGDISVRLGESLASFCERLRQVVHAIFESGMTPIMLGGDHSLSMIPLSLLADRLPAFGIIHFDAHTDLYDAAEPEAVNHANFLLPILERPSLRRLHQIGLRGFQTVAAKQSLRSDPRISYVSARELRRLRPADVFADLRTDIPYYLTFDIDCLTPQLAVETGTKLIGGLEYYDALELVDYVGRHFRLLGADIVEVAYRPDSAQWAAQAAAHLLAELLFSFSSPQPLSSYWMTGLGSFGSRG